MARELLTEDAVLRCDHAGRVDVEPTQDLVRIEGRRVLVKPDPKGRPVRRCMIPPPPIAKPCRRTLTVDAGYSDLVLIDGVPACLSAVTGFTDGLAPGTARFQVYDPGQPFVEQEDES